ncbi:MAG: ComE operon protein 3 [Candidatus Celerinatantimonas neptuna]|nr:MAG: ComE operon protein 3 [Candidatus Celerinatantimonas neptuna]
MNLLALGWMLALVSSLFWPSLPSIPTIIGVALFACYCLNRRYYLIVGLCFGACWFSWQALQYSQAVNQLYQHNTHYTIQGRIISVSTNQYRQSFLLQIDTSSRFLKKLHGRVVRLSEYHHPRRSFIYVYPGDVIRAGASIKPCHSSLNQGGFNYQRWMISKNIIGQGNVRQVVVVHKISTLRSALLEQLRHFYRKVPQSAIINALITGERSDINPRQKLLWMHAGVGHLLAISGLHLGILAFWGYWLGRLLTIKCRWGKRLIPSAISILLACSYGYLADWPLSAQRAAVMLCVWLLSQSINLSISRIDSWLLALLGVTIIWPLSVLSDGLWLSFGAIIILFLLLWWCPWKGWRQMLVIQSGLLILMLPMQACLFGYISIWSLPLNLIFIPVFSLLIIPMLLVGVVLGCLNLSVSHLILSWVGDMLNFLSCIINFVAQHSSLIRQIAKSQWIILLLILLVVGLTVLMRGYYVMVGLVLWIITPSIASRGSDWWVHFLDVGQGLAIVIESHHHVVIYDTGNRYPTGFSYAKAAIEPFLVSRRDKSVDMIVVSHADRDHFGGYSFLHQEYPKAQTIFGDDPRFPWHNCHGRIHWRGLILKFIQPRAEHISNNNRSCLLLVSDGLHRILLTGDIETRAELWWVRHFHQNVDGISVPHHGSRTSSSLVWLEHLSPIWAVISRGFMNAYGFPHPSVISRYKQQGIRVYDTGKDGQISVHIKRSQIKLMSYRQNIKPFWYNRLRYK